MLKSYFATTTDRRRSHALTWSEKKRSHIKPNHLHVVWSCSYFHASLQNANMCGHGPMLCVCFFFLLYPTIQHTTSHPVQLFLLHLGARVAPRINLQLIARHQTASFGLFADRTGQFERSLNDMCIHCYLSSVIFRLLPCFTPSMQSIIIFASADR